MKDIKCPKCGKEIARHDWAVNNHLRKAHPEISMNKRTKIRIEIFGDQRENHKAIKKQKMSRESEQRLAKELGIK